MKTTSSLFGIFVITFGLLVIEPVNGEVFVLSIPSSPYPIPTNAVVGEFTTSGETVDASLIQQSSTTYNWNNGGLAYDGNGHLFVGTGNAVGEYTTAGTVVNSSLISSLNDVFSIVVDGGHLFVIWETTEYVPYVAEFSTNGTPINVSLISLNGKNGVSLRGDGNGHLFLLTGSTIEEYATSGAALYLPLVNFSSYCNAFAVDKSGYIYADNGNGGVSKYTMTGTLVDASLISGLPSSLSDITVDANGNVFLLMGNSIAEYSSSGLLIKSSIISGLQGYSLVVTPSLHPSVNLIKAVVPTFSDLLAGTNYQLQVSSDLVNWTNQGSSFTATNSSMVYPRYFNVNNWNQLFFRLQVAP